MSFVYYSLLSTSGPPLINAQLALQSNWSTPSLLSAQLAYLRQIDFADYDARRRAIASLSTLKVPTFAYTYPFDPLAFPIVPPQRQTRFPASGTFVRLDITYAPILADLSTSLAYRDSDGPIAAPLALFTDACVRFSDAIASEADAFDRTTFELLFVLIWALYPAIP